MAHRDIAHSGAADLLQRSRAPANPGADSLDAPTEAQELRRMLEHQKRTFDLAMSASQMGTWRYTFADNICLYDENAQRLYGLADGRFLHDEEGVKAKSIPMTSI